MAGFEIRAILRPDDLSACAAMMATTDPWLRFGLAERRAIKILGDPVKEAYVALDAAGVAGFITIDMRGLLCGYIHILCVRADRRGQGVGTALIGRAEERIFSESPNAFICASSFNAGARRLYERLGYELVGPLRDMFIRGADEMLYRKTRGSWAEFRQRAPRGD